MPIATNDLAAAGARPPTPIVKASGATATWASLWGQGGSPVTGVFDTTLNGVTLDGTTTGAVTRVNPASGSAYLYSLSGTYGSTVQGALFIVDRIWHNGGFTITSTSAQTITSPTWPSRCPTSATDDTPSTSGHGVLLAVEVSAAAGAATPVITVSYTNSAGTASRTGTSILTSPSSPGLGTWLPIGLQSGDVGVQSVQSLTLSASWISGTINLVAYRIIGVAPIGRVDWYTAGSGRIYDNSCLAFVIATNGGTAAPNPSFTLTETHG